MSLFSILTLVCKRLEKLERDFLWEGSMVDRKYHLVKWDKVCSSIRDGGLGIKKLKLVNKALMGKWLWRFMVDKDALWWRVVVSRFGVGNHF